MADQPGLYDKYIVKRTDGSDGPGAKHDGCEYFILDLTHDPHARRALIAYANSCQAERPQLADDIYRAAADRATKRVWGGTETSYEQERESNDPHTHHCSGCGRAWQHMEADCPAPVYPLHCRLCPR